VERLTAGCSARPRESCKTRRRGSSNKPESQSLEGTASTALSSDPTGADDNAAEGDGMDEPGKDGKDDVKGDGKPSPLPRPEVQVGDVIKVQTNLGWENVTVKAKRTNGKIDIQFKDGEYMRSVLPRILRESVPDRSGDKDGEQLPASSSGTLSASLPKTARGGKDSSVAASSASKVPPLPPPCSPIDNARGSWAAAAAAAVAASASNVSLLGGPLRDLGKEAPTTSVGAASGVIAAAANAIAGQVGNLANIDMAAVITNTAPSSSPPPEDEAIQQLASFSALPSNPPHSSILVQLQKQRSRASVPGGENAIRGPAYEPLPLAGLTPLQPSVPPPGGRGTGLRPQAQAPSAATGSLHEVRLRSHLQQLISVRPIVTRRMPGGPDEAPKSPRSAAKRSSGFYGGAR